MLASQPVPSKTIIDILSSSPEFSEVLDLVQHLELVPLINQSWNVTFLAPINSAFVGIDKSTITRDQLLYHLINTTAYSSQFAESTRIYKTFLDDGKALISLSLTRGVNYAVSFEDLDILASPQRGLVHSLAKILDIPPTLSKRLFLDSHMSSFAHLVDNDRLPQECTVLAPANSGLLKWLSDGLGDANSSKPLLDFLLSPFGKVDRANLVKRHIYPKIISLSDKPQELQLWDGSSVTLYPNFTFVGVDFRAEASSHLKVARNGLFIELENVLAGNSVEFLSITPEKFILGLGGYGLVRALNLYGHHDMIDGSIKGQKPRSIVVPTAGVTTAVYDKPIDAKSSDPNSLILYQFLDGEIPHSDKFHLLNSQMPLRSSFFNQRVHFERRKNGAISLNWELLDETSYHWGNTTFYTSRELLPPPPSLTMALGPLLVSSFSLAFLDQLNRLQLPFTTSWTILLPTRDAWEKNLLLKDYLDSNSDALARVFDNLILKSPFYSDSGEMTVEQFAGKPTRIVWDSFFNKIYLINSELDVAIEAESTDALFDNGVAHVVNTVPLPRDMEISTSDLIISGNREYFLDLLRAAKMTDVLEPAANFTILVPPPRDLRQNNYSVNTDIDKLQAMLKLHLIPNNLIHLSDGDSALTLAGETLEVQAIGPFGKIWGLSPSSATSGQRVLLYESGYTNGIVSGGSSVMFIDRHISPRWIIPIHFGLRKGTYAIFGVLFGLFMASTLVFGLVWLISRQNRAIILDEETSYRDDNDTNDFTDADRTGNEENHEPIENSGITENRSFGRHLNPSE